jgi:hypothetical protein
MPPQAGQSKEAEPTADLGPHSASEGPMKHYSTLSKVTYSCRYWFGKPVACSGPANSVCAQQIARALGAARSDVAGPSAWLGRSGHGQVPYPRRQTLAPLVRISVALGTREC